IGRFGLPRRQQSAAPKVALRSAALSDSVAVPEPYQSTTSQYLGKTAALLVSLPSEVQAGRADDRFLGRAHDLLRTTRLLLAAPAKPARPPKTPSPVEAPALPDRFMFELPPMPMVPMGPMELPDMAPLLSQLDQLRFQDFDFRAQDMDLRAHELGLRAEELAQKTLGHIDVD